MNSKIKKQLTKNWFRMLQDMICQDIEELENKNDTRPGNMDPSINYSEGFEEYIDRIPSEKLELLDSFMNVKENDAYLVLASNQENLSKLVNPSCQKISGLLENPILYHNQLRSNYRKLEYKNLNDKGSNESRTKNT